MTARRAPRRARAERSGGDTVRTPGGLEVLVETSHALPLVEVHLTFLTGSLADPEGREGLARLTARMVRMGTRKLRAPEVEESIDALGAHLGIETAPSYVRFGGVVIRKNLEAFLALVAQLLATPAFRVADVQQVVRETVADIIEGRDNDRGLAAQGFRRALFAGHPYARPVVGTRASVASVTRDDIVRAYQRQCVAGNCVVSLAGDVTREAAVALVEAHLGWMLPGHPERAETPAPRMPRGRRVVIVDKPERTQTQVYVGCLGTRPTDADHHALTVGNTAFGGTFTARLMKEVRSKRGWSYGAYSRLGSDRQRESWSMWTFPAAKDAVPCIELELAMLEALLSDGITTREAKFAKDYLVNSYAFEVDTAPKRVEQRVDERVFGLPAGFHESWVERIAAVRVEDANAALRARLSADDLVIAVVATASEVRDALAKLPGVTRVDVVPHDDD